ncbi:MAG: hypothetical protein HY521_00335 [Proteobacteria bacterium]|nr:hypothetical protein [Pseudomonadota bacterium]
MKTDKAKETPASADPKRTLRRLQGLAVLAGSVLGLIAALPDLYRLTGERERWDSALLAFAVLYGLSGFLVGWGAVSIVIWVARSYFRKRYRDSIDRFRKLRDR